MTSNNYGGEHSSNIRRKIVVCNCFVLLCFSVANDMGVFMIGVPKKNDLFLKDYNGQLNLKKFILHYYSCNELLYASK
jgi:hypothetical protein